VCHAVQPLEGHDVMVATGREGAMQRARRDPRKFLLRPPVGVSAGDWKVEAQLIKAVIEVDVAQSMPWQQRCEWGLEDRGKVFDDQIRMLFVSKAVLFQLAGGHRTESIRIERLGMCRPKVYMLEDGVQTGSGVGAGGQPGQRDIRALGEV